LSIGFASARNICVSMSFDCEVLADLAPNLLSHSFKQLFPSVVFSIPASLTDFGLASIFDDVAFDYSSLFLLSKRLTETECQCCARHRSNSYHPESQPWRHQCCIPPPAQHSLQCFLLAVYSSMRMRSCIGRFSCVCLCVFVRCDCKYKRKGACEYESQWRCQCQGRCQYSVRVGVSVCECPQL
jgi:hypothetical protein